MFEAPSGDRHLKHLHGGFVDVVEEFFFSTNDRQPRVADVFQVVNDFLFDVRGLRTNLLDCSFGVLLRRIS
jgi:hypothetical protein